MSGSPFSIPLASNSHSKIRFLRLGFAFTEYGTRGNYRKKKIRIEARPGQPKANLHGACGACNEAYLNEITAYKKRGLMSR